MKTKEEIIKKIRDMKNLSSAQLLLFEQIINEKPIIYKVKLCLDKLIKAEGIAAIKCYFSYSDRLIKEFDEKEGSFLPFEG